MCACVIKSEKWRETEWISVCGLCGLGVCVCERCKPWRSALSQWAGAVRVLACESCAHEFHRLPVTWQSPRARGDCVFAVNIPSDPFVCDVTCTDSDKQRSLIPSNPGRRATSGLFAPLSLFSSPHPACFAWQGLCCTVGCVTFRRVDFCSVWSICLYSHQCGRFWITAGNTKDLILPTWFICTDLRSPAECKENISSVSSKTFHRPRSSYIVRWYFHSIVQMHYLYI